MKRKKLWSVMMMLMIVVGSMVVLSSCGDDGDEGIPSVYKNDVSVTASADELTYHSALLKGYSNGANGKVGFCYSNTITDPTPDNSMCVVTSLINADNSYTITVDELKVNTTYYYRAFATKDNMVVLAKEVKTFKTKEIIFEAVDLGLPSGMKWANMNVGATTPEEYGDYFAWGETEPYYMDGQAPNSPYMDWKTDKTAGYDWKSYKWCKGSSESLTKYSTKSNYGIVDNKTVLEPEDDAAHVNWGGSWRMPTKAEQEELRINCTWTWTSLQGVNGYKVTGPNGNSIFLPASGSRWDGTLYNSPDHFSGLWSSSLNTSTSIHAYCLYFFSKHVEGVSSAFRCNGNNVRAVCQ